MATAELAVAMPALLLVLATALGGVALGIDQVRCVDAARLAARELARGVSHGAAYAVAVSAAPRGAEIRLSQAGGDVVATVGVRRELLLGSGLTVQASSTAQREQP